jgi:hypothetical protein
MDKKEALSRLYSLEREASELRKIIEKPDDTKVFDTSMLYVAVVNRKPYLLAGVDNKFSWWGFEQASYESPTHNRLCDRSTAQEALDRIAIDGTLYSFSNPREGIAFFCDEYMKAHK